MHRIVVAAALAVTLLPLTPVTAVQDAGRRLADDSRVNPVTACGQDSVI